MQAGINEVVIILSFDSDTDGDTEASVRLFSRLKALDIPATFAVPGAQLKVGGKTYTSLLRQGARFINHGGGAHTEFRDGRYWSVGFYNQKSDQAVREDIRLGHRIFLDVLGEEPLGFRAPHFGHFQGDRDLALIHEELETLGSYKFCSSSLAYRTRTHGPLIPLKGLLEIPVAGTYTWPTRLFDSYGYLISKADRRVTDAYAGDLLTSIRQFCAKGRPALLNYYADPSHVAGSVAYFETLKKARDLGVCFSDFHEVLLMAEAAELVE